ncbi:MAG: 5-oxoprolinase subunit PxpB, partial [Pyrinomonadaceae bacterium]
LEVLRSNISSDGTAFETVAAHVESILSKTTDALKVEDRRMAIPVNFSKEDALDLIAISDRSGVGPNDVIEIFTAIEYRVFMLGFLPGFAYMGEVDAKIAMPRRDSPRLKTPKGSVGIAGRQTGIYPFESPGGWQIVGRTDVEMFDPTADPPCLLRPGDLVRFVPI